MEDGITIGGKPLKDHYEAIGHAQAYDFLHTLTSQKMVREEDVKKIHHLFYFRIEEEHAGNYRLDHAMITGSKYPLPKPEQVPSLMKELFPRIDGWRKKFHPVQVAALVHKEFVFIHPFVDGNGRAARLLMNLVLMQHGYTIAMIPPVLQSHYIDCLEKAHTHDQDFISFVASMVRETQKDYLRLFVRP